MENYLKEINLTWKGPIPFEKFKDSEICKSHTDLNENGIYLFCIEENNNDDKFAVTYVGVASSYSIFDRISSWLKLTKNKGIGSYFRYDSNSNEDELEIIMTHFEGENIGDELIKHNIDKSFLFYTVPDETALKIIEELYRPLYEIEGTIKNILRKKMGTRKYLISLEPPKYGINPNRIKNLLEDNRFSIKGF